MMSKMVKEPDFIVKHYKKIGIMNLALGDNWIYLT